MSSMHFNGVQLSHCQPGLWIVGQYASRTFSSCPLEWTLHGNKMTKTEPRLFRLINAKSSGWWKMKEPIHSQDRFLHIPKLLTCIIYTIFCITVQLCLSYWQLPYNWFVEISAIQVWNIKWFIRTHQCVCVAGCVPICRTLSSNLQAILHMSQVRKKKQNDTSFRLHLTLNRLSGTESRSSLGISNTLEVERYFGWLLSICCTESSRRQLS